MKFWPYEIQDGSVRHIHAQRIERAVKRALDNIWFGQPDPIAEAIESILRTEGIQLERREVEKPLAKLVNLIVLELRRVPTSIEPMLVERIQELRDDIIRGHTRLQKAQEERWQLGGAVHQKEWDLQALRQRLSQLEQQERILQRRLRQLARAEREVQEQLASIAGWEPVSLERARAIAEGLAEAAQEDLPQES
ncbi:MAG TPA: hypothetical protein VH593_01095 [Ktedonobacteraceae bacterium]